MGKGDKRTAKGKRFVASYGNSRPKKKSKKVLSKAKAKTKTTSATTTKKK